MPNTARPGFAQALYAMTGWTDSQSMSSCFALCDEKTYHGCIEFVNDRHCVMGTKSASPPMRPTSFSAPLLCPIEVVLYGLASFLIFIDCKLIHKRPQTRSQLLVSARGAAINGFREDSDTNAQLRHNSVERASIATRIPGAYGPCHSHKPRGRTWTEKSWNAGRPTKSEKGRLKDSRQKLTFSYRRRFYPLKRITEREDVINDVIGVLWD